MSNSAARWYDMGCFSSFGIKGSVPVSMSPIATTIGFWIWEEFGFFIFVSLGNLRLLRAPCVGFDRNELWLLRPSHSFQPKPPLRQRPCKLDLPNAFERLCLADKSPGEVSKILRRIHFSAPFYLRYET